MNFTDFTISSLQGSPDWNLDYSVHVITNSTLEKHAFDFKKRIWVRGSEGRVSPMAELMFEEYDINSIQRMIYPDSDGIKAVRVYFGLDLSTNRIHHFFEPVMMREPLEGPRGDFEIPLSSASQSHADTFTGTLYKIEDKELRRIDNDATEMRLFITLWNNYKDFIRFESYLLDDFRLRLYDEENDVESGILPLDVFTRVVTDNESTSGYIYSSLSTTGRSYRHSFCLSNYEILQRKTLFTPLSLLFAGAAANYAQLCPTRCGRLKAISIDSGSRTFQLL
jgi:hypothetical protein